MHALFTYFLTPSKTYSEAKLLRCTLGMRGRKLRMGKRPPSLPESGQGSDPSTPPHCDASQHETEAKSTESFLPQAESVVKDDSVRSADVTPICDDSLLASIVTTPSRGDPAGGFAADVDDWMSAIDPVCFNRELCVDTPAPGIQVVPTAHSTPRNTRCTTPLVHSSSSDDNEESLEGSA